MIQRYYPGFLYMQAWFGLSFSLFFLFCSRAGFVDFSTINSTSIHCLQTHKHPFSVTFSLKMSLTILFTHLKIILLQYFQVQQNKFFPNKPVEQNSDSNPHPPLVSKTLTCLIPRNSFKKKKKPCLVPPNYLLSKKTNKFGSSSMDDNGKFHTINAQKVKNQS